jgi:hypothetical protein
MQKKRARRLQRISFWRVVGMIFGLLVIAFGIYIPHAQRFWPYKTLDNVQINDYIIGDSSNDYTDYFNLVGSKLVFYAHEKDFTPQLDAHSISSNVTVVYRTLIQLTSYNVDVKGSGGLELKAPYAYQVEEIVSLGNGETFFTAMYRANPSGEYVEPESLVVPTSLGFVAVGLLIILATLFVSGAAMRKLFGFSLFSGGLIVTVLNVTYIFKVVFNSVFHANILAGFSPTVGVAQIVLSTITSVSLVIVGWLLFRGAVTLDDVDIIDLPI